MNAITLSLATWLTTAIGSVWPDSCSQEPPPMQTPASPSQLDLPRVPRLSTFRLLERPVREGGVPNFLLPPTAVQEQIVRPPFQPTYPVASIGAPRKAAPPVPLRDGPE